MSMLDVPTRGKRPCATCFEVLPHTLEHFPYDPMGRGGTRPHCIECYNAKRREAYAANPEPTRQRMRERYAARAEQYRRALTPRGQGPSSCSDTEERS